MANPTDTQFVQLSDEWKRRLKREAGLWLTRIYTDPSAALEQYIEDCDHMYFRTDCEGRLIGFLLVKWNDPLEINYQGTNYILVYAGLSAVSPANAQRHVGESLFRTFSHSCQNRQLHLSKSVLIWYTTANPIVLKKALRISSDHQPNPACHAYDSISEGAIRAISQRMNATLDTSTYPWVLREASRLRYTDSQLNAILTSCQSLDQALVSMFCKVDERRGDRLICICRPGNLS